MYIIENVKIYELIYNIGHLGNMNEHIIKSSDNIDDSDTFMSIIINKNRELRSYYGKLLMKELNISEVEFTNIWCYIKHLSISYVHNIELIEKYSHDFDFENMNIIIENNKSYLQSLNFIIENITNKTNEKCNECDEDLNI